MLSKAFRSKQLAEELQWWQTLSIMSINNFPLKKFHNCASTEVEMSLLICTSSWLGFQAANY